MSNGICPSGHQHIPPTRNIFTTAPITVAARRRVAGYARVSTDSDEQFTSYEPQIDPKESISMFRRLPAPLSADRLDRINSRRIASSQIACGPAA